MAATWLAAIMMTFSCGWLQAETAAQTASQTGTRTLEWADLIPAGFDADQIIDEYDRKYRLSELSDEDPRLQEMMAKVEAAYQAAPVKPELNNTAARIAGYVVPLATDGTRSSEFLLVPYFGACIHVPPPPANQTILVRVQGPEGAAIRKLYDVVWVSGVIKTQFFDGGIARAGYILEAGQVEPYE
ncbi:MAG: DUF3299 domain-containing protein [Pseudomonadota bacterium]|nr:DUF3299 domain-containing protein [Pseudomonadota bacterium]